MTVAAGRVQQAASVELLIGAAIIGTNGLMVRLAGMPPTAVAFWRMLLAGVVLAALVSVRHGWQPLSRKAWLWCSLPVALAGLLLAQPIVACLLDVAFFDIAVSPQQWLGLAVSLIGIFVAGMKSRGAVAAQEA